MITIGGYITGYEYVCMFTNNVVMPYDVMNAFMMHYRGVIEGVTHDAFLSLDFDERH